VEEQGGCVKRPRIAINEAVTTFEQDDYDTLHFLALAFGGIGAGRWWVTDPANPYGQGIPCCLDGACLATEDVNTDSGSSLRGRVQRALSESAPYQWVIPEFNDPLVRRVNKALGRPEDARISWAEYTKYGNIRRAA
jgi:hypothetical protein